MTPEEGRMIDALSRGESVPGGPGACAGCGHLTLWHGNNGRYKGKPCRLCDCHAFTKSADVAATPRHEWRGRRLVARGSRATAESTTGTPPMTDTDFTRGWRDPAPAA